MRRYAESIHIAQVLAMESLFMLIMPEEIVDSLHRDVPKTDPELGITLPIGAPNTGQ